MPEKRSLSQLCPPFNKSSVGSYLSRPGAGRWGPRGNIKSHPAELTAQWGRQAVSYCAELTGPGNGWVFAWGAIRSGSLRLPLHKGAPPHPMSTVVGGVLRAQERGYLRGREVLPHLLGGLIAAVQPDPGENVLLPQAGSPAGQLGACSAGGGTWV